MKRILRPIFFSLVSCCGLVAQEHSLSGRVENAQNEAIAYANVQLLKAADSVMAKGASTDENGRFEIPNIPSGLYLVKASYIGNESELRPIEIRGDTVLNPLTISADAQELEEVTVKSLKPRLERKADRLVFNIENTAFSDGAIWDALKRTPNVIIVNDELTVKGSSAVGILINGRKINLPKGDVINLLSGVSASDVEAIEVITNPPAKYNAEDGILINIRKKKNLVAGYNGAIYNRYRQGILPKHTVGTDHYFKGEKTGFSVNYSFGHDRDVTKYTDITDFIENGAVAATWTGEQEYVRKRKRHNLSAFFDYDFNAKNRLSLSAITVWQPQVDRFYDTETTIVGDTLSGFDTFNDSDERQLNTSYYLDYTRELGDAGAELSFSSHYTYYDYERGQDLNTLFFDLDGSPSGREDFTTDSEQRINLYSAQVDYLTPLGDDANVETGIRYAGIDSRNKVAQQGFNREEAGIDPTEAGNFDYDESIYAGYASFNATWDKWELKSGLRAEYTETSGELDVGSQRRDNDYFQLFPSASIQFTPSEKSQFQTYYYRRIERPRYEDISPFVIFQSNFSTIEGDINLQPSTRHYLAGGYTFDKSYTVELFYKNKKNGLGQLTFQDNDLRLLRFISSNIEREISYGVDFTLNKDITNFWNCYFLISVYEDRLSFNNLNTDIRVENQLLGWFMRSNNSFTLLKDSSLTADLGFYYAGPMLYQNVRVDGYGDLNLSFRKTLWDKRASISVGIQDIFNQGNQLITRDYLDQSGTSLTRGENRLFVLGLRYKFGNTKIRDNYKNKGVDEEDRL